MTLRAILFGADTFVDRRDVERRAFNRVFDEARLSWQWDAATYARLCRLAADGDVLDAFVRTERPHWRQSADLQHLLAAVRRRHAAVCRDIVADPAAVDRDMLAIAAAAQAQGLSVCAILPAGEALPLECHDIPSAVSHVSALTAVGVAADACLAVECTANGFEAAAATGIPTLEKLAIAPCREASRMTAVMALLEDMHARRKPDAAAVRIPSIVSIA